MFLRDEALEAIRGEALWLARSAVLNTAPGSKTLRLNRGDAALRVEEVRGGGKKATVRYAGREATVTTSTAGWDERFE